jgi:ribokinase
MVYGFKILSKSTMHSYVSRMPKFGETIHSESFEVGYGGKGSNQAIASARLGCKTAMIGKIGSDGYGKNYKRHFEEEGINTEYLETAGEYSGIALIVVNSVDGDNQIVINANANKFLSVEDCVKAKSVLDQSKVICG